MKDENRKGNGAAWSASAFEEFWARYPRKVGKKAAQREWEKAHVTPELFAKMQHTLTWEIEQWDDPQFIPHPKTWLSQGRWDDQPTPALKRTRVPCPHTPPCPDEGTCWMKTVGYKE